MLFKAYFLDNVNIGEADNVLKIAAAAGCKPDISIDRWLKAPF